MADAKVYKTVIQVTVLHEKDDAPVGCSLSKIDREMAEGTYVGQSRIVSTEPIPDDRVKDELTAVNNDGEFFDHLFDKDGE